MIKETAKKIFVIITDMAGVIFLTVLFYVAIAVLFSPLALFLEKKIEFMYGLF